MVMLSETENDFVEKWRLKNNIHYKGEAVADIVKNFKKMVVKN